MITDNSYYQLDTPCLLVDRPKMERNIGSMVKKCHQIGVKLRPHIKTHKIPEIAIKQVALSHHGIAVSKLGEAEVMFSAGIKDILIANQVIGEQKIKRLSNLDKEATVKLCIDSVIGIKQLQQYTSGKPIEVLIEINTGMNRCGVNCEADINILLKAINDCPKVKFIGFMSHSGNIYTATNKERLTSIALEEIEIVNSLAAIYRDKGYDLQSISIGSTPSSLFVDRMSGITEFRPGNYVFYDYIQVCLGVVPIEACALSVLATVISKPTSNRVIIDAGSKSLGLDRGAHSSNITPSYGYIIDNPNLNITRLSEEHGIIEAEGVIPLEIGDKIVIIPNHACAVTNLFDEVYLTNDGEIIDHWKIAARGKVR